MNGVAIVSTDIAQSIQWQDLAKSVVEVFGPRKLAILGNTPELEGALKCLAGASVLAEDRQSSLAGVVVCDLTDLPAILRSSDAIAELFAVVYTSDFNDRTPLRARVEQIFLDAGYIKSTATNELFEYSRLDEDSSECRALFEYRPLKLAPGESSERMKLERDLHADMLREAGVRSDAHVVRYQLAATLIRRNDRVLDAACGLGYGSFVLSRQSQAGHVTGIDISEWGVAHATRNYGEGKIAFECGSLPEALLKTPVSTYDFVVSLETLEHVADPVALLREFWRVIKPGGRVFVSVPNDWADETGKDPNPHHLHVYTWSRLVDELNSAQFIVESAWSLTAGGCKTGADRRWRAQPRKLSSVALADAPETEGEWWLVCAMKSPLKSNGTPYEETVHVGFEGTSSLVDFHRYYDNPWLVHSLVELPWRIRDPSELVKQARLVIVESAPSSADRGAGLAVLGWRLFLDGAVTPEWLADVDRYLNQALCSDNTHVGRWGISLRYLVGRVLEAKGQDEAAQVYYEQIVNTNVLGITPTLATKQADASLRAGMLAYRGGKRAQAKALWQSGLHAVFECLRANPIEFVGNFDDPFIFPMNDLVEITDGATRLANALHALARDSHPSVEARQLGVVAQRSLRSAVVSLERTVRLLGRELDAQRTALAHAKTLAFSRQAEAKALATQLADTEAAKAVAEHFAHSRLAQLEAMQAPTVDLGEAQSLLAARQAELETLSGELARMREAKDTAETFAYSYLAHFESVQNQVAALDHAQSLAIARQAELELLAAELERTQAAKDVAEAFAHSRLTQLEEMHRRLADAEVERAKADELALRERDYGTQIAQRLAEAEALLLEIQTRQLPKSDSSA